VLSAMAIGGWGVQWDIRWHILIGRDSFWIAPHVMTYTGITLSALIAFGMLALERARGRPSRGWLLAALGMALTIAAAAIAELWHRRHGVESATSARARRSPPESARRDARGDRPLAGAELEACDRRARRGDPAARDVLRHRRPRGADRVSPRWRLLLHVAAARHPRLHVRPERDRTRERAPARPAGPDRRRIWFAPRRARHLGPRVRADPARPGDPGSDRR